MEAAIPLALTAGSALLSASAGNAAAQSERQRAAGIASGYQWESVKAERAAEAGRIAADQTDAALREELDRTLDTIVAVRAAAGADIRSPTGQAVLDRESEVSDRERRIRVGNLRSQAASDEMSSDYFRTAAGQALRTGETSAFGARLGGYASAVGRLASGFGDAFSRRAGGTGSAGTIGGTGLPGNGGLY
jgi:hypothetical protein